MGLTTNRPAHVHPAGRVSAGRDIAQKSATWAQECGSHNECALLGCKGEEGCHWAAVGLEAVVFISEEAETVIFF